MRVLGDRVLIRPDVIANAPEQRESGIVLAKSLAAAVTGEDATTSLCRGTVIAVGTPRHPLRTEADDLADRITLRCGATDDDDCILDAAHLLRDLVRKQPIVTIGDDVLFSHDAGQALTLDGTETVLLLREAELLAVIAPETEAA